MEKIKVVIWAVDDDFEWLILLRGFLIQYGVDLIVFDKHDDFFDILDDTVDIVLMDVHMPSFNIREGLIKMYAINNRILTILMSNPSTILEYREINSIRNGNGIFRFVEKGFKGEDNNTISYMGNLRGFDCFETIRIFIEEAKIQIDLNRPIRLLNKTPNG